MRFIPTRVHGFLDYGVGILLILAPFLLGFATGGPEMWIPIVLGVGTILYSLLTDYELAAMRLIPMPVHLAIDGIAGLFLALSPWLFGFADGPWNMWAPHLVVGLLEIGAAVFTHTVPTGERTHHGRPAHV